MTPDSRGLDAVPEFRQPCSGGSVLSWTEVMFCDYEIKYYDINYRNYVFFVYGLLCIGPLAIFWA